MQYLSSFYFHFLQFEILNDRFEYLYTYLKDYETLTIFKPGNFYCVQSTISLKKELFCTLARFLLDLYFELMNLNVGKTSKSVKYSYI